VNCGAIPTELVEAELFGHVKGAYTHAHSSRAGLVSEAEGGTLFLDEIDALPYGAQAKLLRFLQDKEYRAVGSNQVVHADVRVIAATNRNLASAIARQTFREDLYYRLNVFAIHTPPLRERPEDVLVLADAFLEDLGRTMGRPAAGISRDAREWLLAYPWPGNVRELRNAIERAILLCDGGLIAREHLPRVLSESDGDGAPGANGANGRSGPHVPVDADGMHLESMERGYITKALERAKGNKSKAARILGLTRSQLYSRLEKYGVR